MNTLTRTNESAGEATPPPAAQPFREPSRYERALLLGLQRKKKHVYGGTVPAGVVAERRAKNRAARAARRLNRGRR